VAASKVQPGDFVQPSVGPPARVLCSGPETQTAGSGSASVWHIEHYSPGAPTHRMLVAPSDLVEVVDEARATELEAHGQRAGGAIRP
jgi:hypothetical protein